LRKKPRTVKPSVLSSHSPPNFRSKSVKPLKAVIEVATAVIARTQLGSSWT
jgi:hypothetical protein